MLTDHTASPSPDVAPLLTLAPARKPRRSRRAPWPLAAGSVPRRTLTAALGRMLAHPDRARCVELLKQADDATTDDARAEVYEVLLSCLINGCRNALGHVEADRLFGSVASILAVAHDVADRLELHHGGAK